MKDEPGSFISRLTAFGLTTLRDVWLVWFVLAALTTLPYVVAALGTPENCTFTGVLTAYDDTFTYFAWMRQAAGGHVLMCDLFTSEQQSCEFFLPLWSVLGFASHITHLSLPVTFHLARLLSGLLLLIVARAVAAAVIRSRTRIRYTLWIYAMSAGFGWLVYVMKNTGRLFAGGDASGSADLNLPEAIAFRSVFAQVHFAIGAALLCGAIKFFFDALVEKKIRRALIAGLLVSVLAVVHPYMIVLACAVAGVSVVTWPWLIDRSKAAVANYLGVARVAGAFSVAVIPGVAYLVYLNRSNEVLREWLRITDTLSPPPWEYALGFGVVAALAVIGFRLLCGSRAPYGRLLLVWTIVQAALLYAPLSFQRRLVEGLQLPLSIAASVALFWMAGRMFERRSVYKRKLFLAAVVVFASITNIAFAAGQVIAQKSGHAFADSRCYVSADLIAAFDWLKANAEPDAVVFSSYLTGNLAPSMTGLRVFLGHYGQTMRSDEKGAQVTAFYTNVLTGESARALFIEHRVRFVIYGPFEQAISKSFEPPVWLASVHRVGNVQVFEVTGADAVKQR